MVDDISITSTVGINEKEAAQVQVYPNPASSSFYIRFTGSAPAAFTAELYNALGLKVNKVDVDNPGNSPVKIDPGNQPEGIYFLKLTYGSVSLTKKVIFID